MFCFFYTVSMFCWKDHEGLASECSRTNLAEGGGNVTPEWLYMPPNHWIAMAIGAEAP